MFSVVLALLIAYPRFNALRVPRVVYKSLAKLRSFVRFSGSVAFIYGSLQFLTCGMCAYEKVKERETEEIRDTIVWGVRPLKTLDENQRTSPISAVPHEEGRLAVNIEIYDKWIRCSSLQAQQKRWSCHLSAKDTGRDETGLWRFASWFSSHSVIFVFSLPFPEGPLFTVQTNHAALH